MRIGSRRHLWTGVAVIVSCLGFMNLAGAGRAEAAPPACSAPAVTTTTGQYCGLTQQVTDFGVSRSTRAYLGIRYGTAARFAVPAPATSSGLQQATQLGNVCPQADLPPGAPVSEDCLFLNVWAPPAVPSQKLPVLVFIYGGGFQEGAISQAVYMGSRLSGKGQVVIVTLNYRLGSLGFLAGGTGPDAITPNLGLRDQALAIKWVQDNIAAFGGDPTHVTLFGESAGAMSIGAHLTNPTTRALFRSAIMESNPYGIPFKDQNQANTLRTLFSQTATVTGACPGTSTTLACLKSLTIDQLVAAQGQIAFGVLDQALQGQLTDLLAWTPQVDPATVPTQPNEYDITKPVIMGTNRAEGNLFVVTQTGTVPPALYNLLVTRLFGQANATKILGKTRYALNQTDNTQSASNIVNDYLFVCANRYVLKQTKGPNYSYWFTHVPSFAVWPGAAKSCQPVSAGGQGRVCHSFELPYVFRNPVAVTTPATPNGLVPPGIAFKANEQGVVNLLTDYWTSFAANDVPTSASAPAPWQRFRANGRRQIIDGTAGYTNDSQSNCPLWDSIGYDLGATNFGLFLPKP